MDNAQASLNIWNGLNGRPVVYCVFCTSTFFAINNSSYLIWWIIILNIDNAQISLNIWEVSQW